MSSKITINLGEIQQTLLLPLWGRAVASGQDNSKINDTKAIEIIKKIDYDFSTIAAKINDISKLSWVARSLHIDKVISEFICAQPDSSIVNIGCGLDTTSERTHHPNIKFYNLDLADVMALRKKLFGPDAQDKSIISSFLENDWLKIFNTDDRVLFIAAGVFYYFDENQIKNFFITLADHFNTCEVFFDSASPFGVKIANKNILERKGMDQTAHLKWGLQRAAKIKDWDKRIKLINEFPIFKGFTAGYSFKTKLGLWISDLLKLMSMVHLRIGNSV